MAEEAEVEGVSVLREAVAAVADAAAAVAVVAGAAEVDVVVAGAVLGVVEDAEAT